MGQVILVALFFITLLAGLFSYFAPSQKALNPLGFVMDKSGYNTVVSVNKNKTQQLNMSTNRGLMEVRKQMDDLAQQQYKFLDSMIDEQQILKNAGRQASDIMLEAQQSGEVGSKDILRLQALSTEMQDEQRLLVARGKDLVVLNDQLVKSRQWIADQIDLANLNTESAMNMLQHRYAQLKEQSAAFFDEVTQHNQDVRDAMEKMQDHLSDLANRASYSSTVQQQVIKDRIHTMLEKEHEDMLKVADNEERYRGLLQDARQRLLDSQERINDSMQQTQDLIQEQRQKQEDQQLLSQQRIEDQEQRIQDSQASRN